MYTLRFDCDAQLMEVVWHRIFTPEEVAVYTRDVIRQFLHRGMRSGYRLLMDMGACGAQPRDSLSAFAQHMGSFPKANRIAIVATAPIVRAQVLRVMTQPYLRLFEDAATARAWLLEDHCVTA